MAKIVLMFNEQVIKEFPFIKDGLIIGRKPENDIHIDNLAVSGHHARVDKAGTDYILTDLQSTNGTFVNDEKVVSHKLKHGEHIQIGKHKLLFLEAGKEQTVASEQGNHKELDRTMILDTAKQRDLLAKQKGAAPPTQKPEKVGVLSFLDSSGTEDIDLTKKLTRIGKSENAEVHLSGMFMGATVATISKRPSGYTLTFAGGMTKVKVNGQVIKESAPLNDFDTIEIGSYKMQFYQKDGG